MGYIQEKQRIIDYVTDGGEIIELEPDRSNEKAFYREIERFSEYKKLAIRYPGYKTTRTKCDYCVYLVDYEGEKPISHTEIMNDLYHKTTEGNYNDVINYVENVASVGLEINEQDYMDIDFSNGFDFKELTGLMFYIAIQEDINYPEQRYQGRKMCFYRYLEAVYCKVHNNHNLYEAVEKANARGYIPSNWNDVGTLYNNVSRIIRG